MQTSTEAGFKGLLDPEVLRVSAELGRILVSQDRRTMPGHFAEFSARSLSPGVILLRDSTTIATAIDEIILIWSVSEPEEWTNRMLWIPL